MKRAWQPFERARAYVCGLGLKSFSEWRSYCRSGQKPADIPAAPRSVYGSDFKGWGDWLGTGYVSTQLREYLPFEEARTFVHTLGLSNIRAWSAYCTSGTKPDTIPSEPKKVYGTDFQGYGDWLGTGYVSTRLREFLPFEEARAFVRTLGLSSFKAWSAYCTSGARPDTIPAVPEQVYAAAFKGYGDWLGTGAVATSKRKYLPFEEARAFVHTLGLRNQQEWATYCHSGSKPDTIPTNPHRTYRLAFLGLGDWLGTGNLSAGAKAKMYLPFEEARAFVHTLGLRNQQEWATYTKSGSKPPTIPSDPRIAYGAAFTSMGDWLGTGYVAHARRAYLPYEEARAFVRSLGLSSWEEWYAYCNSGQKPANIPADPSHFYTEFRGGSDWFGTRNRWTAKSLRGLLQDLRPLLSYLNEQELYTILQQGGAMPVLRNILGGISPLQVLRKMVDAERLQQTLADGGESILVSGDERAPTGDMPAQEAELPPFGLCTEQQSEEFSLAQLPTGESGHTSLEHLRVVDGLSSIPGGLDEEAAEFLVANRVHTLWDLYCNEGWLAVEPLLEGHGGAFFSEIAWRFLAEMRGVEELALPEGWSFRDAAGAPALPNAMQRYTAWLVRERRRIGNWSGTGAGKTLAAILSARVCHAHLTLVVTNYATIAGWRRQILAAYPDSQIYYEVPGRCAPHSYLVLNYERFQTRTRHLLVDELVALGPDFVVLDEVQLVKQRDSRASLRRQALATLIEGLSTQNPALHVLGMSATPVINTLLEAKKLLELITGAPFSEDVKATVHNALAMHRLLMRHGFRFRPRYEQELRTHLPTVVRNDLLAPLLEAHASVLAIEQLLLPAKLEVMRPYLRRGTLIYTHYVEGMIGPICQFLEGLGFSVGRYTGEEKAGLASFLAGETEVLVGSSPVGTGLDGLQQVCDRLIMLSLPWTGAAYEQLIGRVRRQGSAYGSVEIIVPQVRLQAGKESWSWDVGRMEVIQYKQTLSDCAVDGYIPETLRLHETMLLQRSREALERWIARAGGQEISAAGGMDIEVAASLP